MEKYDHVMKSWVHFYTAIIAGDKKHDLRNKSDRNFKVGDTILLQEFDQFKGEYTGREQTVKISFITSNDTPCAYSSSALDRDYAILSLELVN
jgi:hypothetical protein